jgi:uncharacterized RDD family membrane protein YckC
MTRPPLWCRLAVVNQLINPAVTLQALAMNLSEETGDLYPLEYYPGSMGAKDVAFGFRQNI